MAEISSRHEFFLLPIKIDRQDVSSKSDTATRFGSPATSKQRRWNRAVDELERPNLPGFDLRSGMLGRGAPDARDRP
jgi:hypothetical protein